MHWRQVVMKNIEKILVPMDLSEDSLAGVGYALNLAKTHGGKVLQVVSYHEFLRSGRKLRERIINDPTLGSAGRRAASRVNATAQYH